MGNIKTGRVRIYKFNSFKALTDAENEIYNLRTTNTYTKLELIKDLKEAYIKDKNQEALDSVSAKIFELETIMKELNSLGINLNTINQFNQTKK